MKRVLTFFFLVLLTGTSFAQNIQGQCNPVSKNSCWYALSPHAKMSIKNGKVTSTDVNGKTQILGTASTTGENKLYDKTDPRSCPCELKTVDVVGDDFISDYTYTYCPCTEDPAEYGKAQWAQKYIESNPSWDPVLHP